MRDEYQGSAARGGADDAGGRVMIGGLISLAAHANR